MVKTKTLSTMLRVSSLHSLHGLNLCTRYRLHIVSSCLRVGKDSTAQFNQKNNFSSKPKHYLRITTQDKSPESKAATRTEVCDILIVGAGAAGLVAGLRGHHHGLKPLVIEKSSKIGGASAYSGGGVWIPNNQLSTAAGVADSVGNALKYLETIVEDVGPASSRERKMAFLTYGPDMIAWLAKLGFKWRHTAGYPDYYPGKVGGVIGRTVEGKVFDLKKLGDWQDHLLTRSGVTPPAIYCNEYQLLALFTSTWKSIGTILKAVVLRTYGRKVLGQKPVTLGKNLIAQLLFLCKNHGIAI